MYRSPQPFPPTVLFDPLESRVLLAAVPAPVTAAVVEGSLQVTGTKRADVILVAAGASDPTLIEVRTGPGGGSVVGAFDRATFADAVVIAGGKGNDVLTVDASVAVSAVLSGGPGRDVLTGGGGSDVLDGGP